MVHRPKSIARIAFIEKLLPRDKPIHYSVGPKYKCDGSHKTFVVDQERFDNSMASFEGKRIERKDSVCHVDLTLPGQMSDVISNALMRGFDKDESRVRTYLDSNTSKFKDGKSLLKATAVEFNLEVEKLEAMVNEYHHVNCNHGPIADR